MKPSTIAMLVFVLLLAAACAKGPPEPQPEKANAIAEINRLGGKVEIDQTDPSKPAIRIELAGARGPQGGSGPTIGDAVLAQIAGLDGLRFLKLDNCEVTDAGLVHLKGVPQLQELSLKSNQISDAGLVNLKALRRLEKLSLATSRVGDVGLAHLKGLTQLREIYLYATLVTAGAAEEFCDALPEVKMSPRPHRRAFSPVDVAKMTFADPVVERRFRRIDAAARRLAQPGWYVKPYCDLAWSVSPSPYWAQWCRHDYLTRAGWSRRRGDRFPNHNISLFLHANREDPKVIRGLELMASWIPKAGWGANLSYKTRGGTARGGEFFNVCLFHDDYDVRWPAGQGHWAVALANSWYSGQGRYGDLLFDVQVSVHGNPGDWRGDGRTPRDPDVMRLLGSAEGFRRAALAELDQLEALAREQILSRKAIIGVSDYASPTSAL